MKVLIVDDSAPIRALAKGILCSAFNLDVRECEDGLSAIEALQDFKPGLVLVDFEMRPMDGAEFTRRLRRGGTGADPRTPVIMMTGHADRQIVLKAREAGVDGFIVKPLTIRAVLERTQAVLSRPRDVVIQS